jgi:hypothetical protein
MNNSIEELFPPMRLNWLAIFTMLLGMVMLMQSLWLIGLQPAYQFQILGAWICFFMSFYLHNRYDKMTKKALNNLRGIMDNQILEIKELMTREEVTVALMISEAERLRLSSREEFN